MTRSSRPFAPVLRAAALALVLVAGSGVAEAEETVPTLSLGGRGTVTATPDTAIVTVGVITQSKTAGPALTENNARMRTLTDALKGAGVAEADLSTSGFQIEPVVVYPRQGSDGSQDPPRVTGYRVDNRVTVKVRDIGAAGDLLDKVVRVGANQVQGIAFTVEDDTALLDEARRRAMADAAAKARVYAEAGGFRLGRLLMVGESIVQPFAAKAAPMARAALDEQVPVEPGTQELTVEVQVNWEILQ